MSVRTVTAHIVKPNGDPWEGGKVRFTLVDDTFRLSPDESYPIQYTEAVANSSGNISVILVADLPTGYEVTMPDGEKFIVYLPLEAGTPITLETLRALYGGVSPNLLPSIQGPTGPTGPFGLGPTGPTGAASQVTGPTGPGGGPAGRVGPGSVWMSRTFSTTVTDADPGNGFVRLNNATQNISTQAFIDLLDTANVTQTTLLDALDDSTNTVKGWIRIEKQTDFNSYLLGTLTAVTTATGYRKLVFTIINSSTANPFLNNDLVYVIFDRTGDAGTNGTNGTNGAVGATGATGATGPAGTTTTIGGIKFIYGDLNGGVISTGVKGYILVPFNCTLTGWTVIWDTGVTATLDVWRLAYATGKPTNSNSIAGTNKPFNTGGDRNTGGMSTWSTSISANDILAVEVESNNLAKWFELTLTYTRNIP